MAFIGSLRSHILLTPGGAIAGTVVDPDGKELFIPTFNWRDLPLANEISEATGLPVTMAFSPKNRRVSS